MPISLSAPVTENASAQLYDYVALQAVHFDYTAGEGSAVAIQVTVIRYLGGAGGVRLAEGSKTIGLTLAQYAAAPGADMRTKFLNAVATALGIAGSAQVS